MAKKASTIEECIAQRYGKDVICSANSIIENPRNLIPVSPAFDLVMEGILDGSLISLSGLTQCGKTSLALDIASTCQKEEGGNREIYYYDIENRLGKRNLYNIDKDKFTIIKSSSGSILTANDFLQIGLDLIAAKPKSVHIFDSFGALASAKETQTDLNDNSQPGDINRLINRFIRNMARVTAVNNNIVIAINHVYTNVGGYGKKILEKISSEVTYQSEYRFLWKKHEPWCSPSTSDNQIGQIMTIEILKSATCSPNKIVTSYLRYGHGIDKVMETITIGINIGIIKKGGAWYTLEFVDEKPSFQGIDNLYQEITEKPEMLSLLQQKIRELLS